uniref:Uncharacterized protein n=1 Tax=Loxodonta africana TaxID=9785 RepID=G3UDG9_LOXAF
GGEGGLREEPAGAQGPGFATRLQSFCAFLAFHHFFSVSDDHGNKDLESAG